MPEGRYAVELEHDRSRAVCDEHGPGEWKTGITNASQARGESVKHYTEEHGEPDRRSGSDRRS